jgi:hypothetical protein
MAQYRVITEYKDGSKKTLETTDGARAMQEAANVSYQEDQPKTVSLEKDGQTIWSESVKAWKESKGL